MDKNRSQNETIQKLCMNRKQENFEYLKEWDMKRAKTLMIHRKLIDDLDDAIQNKLGESNAYIDVVRQFLTDLLTQKIKYELQAVNNPESKIKNNLAGKSIHKNSAKSLGRLYQMTNNYKGYKKLKVILENGLEKLEQLLVESQKQIFESKTKIQLTINEVQNNNIAALDLCNSIVSIFRDQKNLRPQQCDRDMYSEEQQFIYRAFVQTEVQKELGKEVVKYLEYVEELEKQKLILIKEVIGSYLEGIKEEHEDEVQLSSLQDILRKETENKYIEECYSSDELFSKSTIKEFAYIQKIHEKQINLKYIKHFLCKLQFEFFGNISYLVLKQYHIYVKVGSELEEISIVVTVDGFLNFYFQKRIINLNNNSQETLLQNIDYSAKIDSSFTMTRNGDITLQIECKKYSRHSDFFDLQKQINLVFNNEDQREQFVEFVSHLIS